MEKFPNGRLPGPCEFTNWFKGRQWKFMGIMYIYIYISAQIIATSHDVTIELRPNFLN